MTGKIWEIERSEANHLQGSNICRTVAAQPLLFGKTKSNNHRRISELWHHLALSGKPEETKISAPKLNFTELTTFYKDDLAEFAIIQDGLTLQCGVVRIMMLCDLPQKRLKILTFGTAN